ncbi:MAG: 3-keto-disaccharide hydrolase [Akkermansiaceae bacterium]
MKKQFFLLATILIAAIHPASANSQTAEPELKGSGVTQLITDGKFTGWKVPSDLWSIDGKIITGDTKGEKLDKPEWIYTEQSFQDFIFSAEIKVSDGPIANSGIYYRVKPFTFTWRKTKISYEAPSGYEYDIDMGTKNNGSLGDWYARPSLRIRTNPDLMKKHFKSGDWNRFTIRAQGNHLEYWLNGVKILDYVDNDPKRSLKGLIGLQMHDKLKMKVQFRNAVVLPLDPDAK